MTYPRVFSHLGLSVPDLDKAVKFYSEVMGWYIIMPPTTIKRDDSDIGIMCQPPSRRCASTLRAPRRL